MKYILNYMGVPFNKDTLGRNEGFDLLKTKTQIPAATIKMLHFQFSFPMDIILKKNPGIVSSRPHLPIQQSPLQYIEACTLAVELSHVSIRSYDANSATQMCAVL